MDVVFLKRYNQPGTFKDDENASVALADTVALMLQRFAVSESPTDSSSARRGVLQGTDFSTLVLCFYLCTLSNASMPAFLKHKVYHTVGQLCMLVWEVRRLRTRGSV